MHTYWEQRAIDSANRMDSALASYTSEMVRSFEQAKKSLQAEINIFYGKYASENKISLADAQKQLSFAELKEFRGDLKEYEKLAKSSIGTYDLTVSNLSKKARVTRLQALEMQCDSILQGLYQHQKVSIEDICTRLYTEQYYHKQFDIEKYTGFQFKFAAPSTDAISKVLAMPVNGTDISTSLWRQDIDTGFKIRQTLNEMFVTGKPPQAFSERLQKVIGTRDKEGNLTGKKYEAYRLLFNESAQVTEQSALQAYVDDGIEEYEVIAVLDSKTTPICREQDNKHYKIGEVVTGVNYPPFHVNCRTTTAPYIPNLKQFSSTRMARDEKGKSVRVKDKSYENWYNSKVERLGKDKVIADEKKIKNESSDFRQYEKYKAIFGKEMPKSFAKFQDLKYNNSEGYEDLKGFYHYKNDNPNSNIEYYRVHNKLEQLRVDGEIRAKGVAVSPKVDISIVDANEHTKLRFSERNLSMVDAKDFYSNAVVALKQRKGTQYQFYSKRGFVAVNTNGIVQSIGLLDDAGNKLVEEVNKICQI